MIYSIILIWLFFGCLAYGWSLAYFQGHFSIIADESYVGDVVFSFFVFLTGPAGLLGLWLGITIFTKNPTSLFKYGFKFK